MLELWMLKRRINFNKIEYENALKEWYYAL